MMDFEIRVVYLGAYQEYRLCTYSIEGTNELSGFGFVRNPEKLSFKNSKSFKIYPTIREAMMNACGLLSDSYNINTRESEFLWFEIDGYRITDRTFLNFI